MDKDYKIKSKQIIYALLDEDRGGDTEVIMYNSYDKVLYEFKHRCDKMFEFYNSMFSKEDYECEMLSKEHLIYNFGESWGNIQIIKQEVL